MCFISANQVFKKVLQIYIVKHWKFEEKRESSYKSSFSKKLSSFLKDIFTLLKKQRESGNYVGNDISWLKERFP